MTWPIPTPEQQVQFLRNIQRLLAEGLFVASYKFALVHALADLAVLKGEDTGTQAAIISQIVDSQKACGASLFRLKQVAADRWSGLVAEVDQIVRTMPLWKLQTVGEERLDFLYENLDRGNRITLKPGVAYCL